LFSRFSSFSLLSFFFIPPSASSFSSALQESRTNKNDKQVRRKLREVKKKDEELEKLYLDYNRRPKITRKIIQQERFNMKRFSIQIHIRKQKKSTTYKSQSSRGRSVPGHSAADAAGPNPRAPPPWPGAARRWHRPRATHLLEREEREKEREKR